jgi:phosphoribosylformylglycinamidine synthase
MLMVVEKGKEQLVIDVFEKWDLPCSHIGEVTNDGMLNFYMNGTLEAVLPAEELVLGGGAPQYDREVKRPAYLDKVEAFNADAIKDTDNVKAVAEKLISFTNIASKKWIYEQYDSMVGTGSSSTNAPSDAAIVIAKPTNKGLALTTDCNSRYVFADPYKGAMIAVAEAARNVVCSGGAPLGVTNCLNFGNPYDPEVYYQFSNAIKGMGDACRRFDTPVTGGNVSFYNQSPDGPVYPTPTIGMVGLLDNVNEKMTLNFKNEGDIIYLVGESRNDINSSEYLHKVHGVEHSPCPYFDLEEEFNLQQAITRLIKDKTILSAHDVSEGGLMITLFESAFTNDLGFDVSATEAALRKDAYWFGEAQSRVVVSVSAEKVAVLEASLQSDAVKATAIGKVTNGVVIVEGELWGQISGWKEKYDNAIGNILKAHESEEALSAI